MIFTVAQCQAKHKQKLKEKGLHEEATKEDVEQRQKSWQKKKKKKAIFQNTSSSRLMRRDERTPGNALQDTWLLIRSTWNQNMQEGQPVFSGVQSMGKVPNWAKQALKTALPFNPKLKKVVCQRLSKAYASTFQEGSTQLPHP